MSSRRVRSALASIGANTRRLRGRQGLSQEGLADLCESLAPRTIQAIEAGRTNLSIAVLVELADALGVDARELLRPAQLIPNRPGRPPKKKQRLTTRRSVS